MASSRALRQAWEEHPHFRYRGCAEDQDVPGRAAGDVSLSLDAWHGDDRDGSEPQREREARQAAAVEVCLNCPVMVQCDAYASSVVVEDGQARLAEPAGIWGGRLARERRDAFERQRPMLAVHVLEAEMLTAQRRAVLLALAMSWDPHQVAAAAGVDVRTANWQRSRLATQLNLDKLTATRAELLEAAVNQGVLDPSLVVADDGTTPAVPVLSPVRSVAPKRVSEPLVATPVIPNGKVFKHKRGPAYIPGQLEFFPAEAVQASVVPLYPSQPLEAAA